MTPRKPRTARPSRLSMTTRLKQLEQENLDFREGLETIADVLEDLGILDPPEDDFDSSYPSEEELVQAEAAAIVPLPPEEPKE